MTDWHKAQDLHAQDPGRGNAPAKAGHAPRLSQRKVSRNAGGTVYVVTPSAGEAFRIVVNGRTQWALDRLRAAGAAGCTPIVTPGPRWAAYVHKLRRMGVEIETLHEPHDGEFPGTHARYVLRAVVTPQGGDA